MRTIVAVGLALGVLAAGAVATPRLVVDRDLFDFGTVADGTVVVFGVSLTNTGTSTLQITRVIYNCICTSYELPVRSLNPGAATTMTVRLDTSGYGRRPQPALQTVTIVSNDPARPQVTITVRGIVRAIAEHEGTATAFYNEYYVLVDLRPAAEFARGHLLGAVSIPFAELPARLGELPRTKIVYLYDATGIEAVQAAQLLQQNAFLLARAISGGLLGWWQAFGDLYFQWAPGAARIPPTGTPFHGTRAVVQPSRVAGNFLYVVDIRSPQAFAQGRFPGAVNVSLGTQDELTAWAARLPRPVADTSLSIWIVDDDGSRACAVAQHLRTLGFQARCLFGGIAFWRRTRGDVLLFPQP